MFYSPSMGRETMNKEFFDKEQFIKDTTPSGAPVEPKGITDADIENQVNSFDNLYFGLEGKNVYNQFHQSRIQNQQEQEAFTQKMARLRSATDLTEPGVDKVIVDVRNEAGNNEIVLRNIHEGTWNQVKSLNNDEGETLLGTNRYAGQNFVYDITGGVNDVWNLEQTKWITNLLDKMGYTPGERADTLQSLGDAITSPGKVFFNYDTIQDQVARHKDPEWTPEAKDTAYATIMATEAGKYLAEQLNVTRENLDNYGSLSAFLYGSNRKYNEAKFGAHAQETLTGGVWDMLSYMGVDVLNDPDTIGELGLAAVLAAVSGGAGGAAYVAGKVGTVGTKTGRFIQSASTLASNMAKAGRLLPTRVIGDFIVPMKRAYSNSKDVNKVMDRLSVSWRTMDDYDNWGTFLLGASGDGLVGGLSAWAMNASTVDSLNEMIYGKGAVPSMWNWNQAISRGAMGIGGAIGLGSVLRVGMQSLNSGVTKLGLSAAEAFEKRKLRRLSLDKLIQAESTVTESLIRKTFNEGGITDEGVIQDVSQQVESAADAAGVSSSRVAQGVRSELQKLRAEAEGGTRHDQVDIVKRIREAAMKAIRDNSNTRDARLSRYVRQSRMSKAIAAQDLKEIESMNQEDALAREKIQSGAILLAQTHGTTDADELGKITVETTEKLDDAEVDALVTVNEEIDNARAELRQANAETNKAKKQAKKERKAKQPLKETADRVVEKKVEEAKTPEVTVSKMTDDEVMRLYGTLYQKLLNEGKLDKEEAELLKVAEAEFKRRSAAPNTVSAESTNTPEVTVSEMTQDELVNSLIALDEKLQDEGKLDKEEAALLEVLGAEFDRRAAAASNTANILKRVLYTNKKFLKSLGMSARAIAFKLKSPEGITADYIVRTLYQNIRTRGADYTDAPSSAETVTGKETKTTTVENQSGWHYRLPKNYSKSKNPTNSRASLNVGYSPELITALDAFFASRFDPATREGLGYYKTPNESAGWGSRHDPITLYLSRPLTAEEQLELTNIISGLTRGNDGLFGTEVSEGFFVLDDPSSDNIKDLIKRAEAVDPDAVKGAQPRYETNGEVSMSAGNFEALKTFVEMAEAEIAAARARPSSETAVSAESTKTPEVTTAPAQESKFPELKNKYSTRESLNEVKGKSLQELFKQVFGTNPPSGVRVDELRTRIWDAINETIEAPELYSPTTPKEAKAAAKQKTKEASQKLATATERKQELIKLISKKLGIAEEAAEILVLQNLKLRSVKAEVKSSIRLAKSYEVEGNDQMPEAVARSLLSGIDARYAHEVDLNVDGGGYVKVEAVVEAMSAAERRAMGNHMIDLMEDPQAIYFGSRMVRTNFEEFNTRLKEFETRSEEVAAAQTVKMRLAMGAKDLTDEDLRSITINGKSAILDKDEYINAALENAKELRELFELAEVVSDTSYDTIRADIAEKLPTLTLLRAELKKLGYSPTVLNSIKADQTQALIDLIAHTQYVDKLTEAAKSADLSEDQKILIQFFTDSELQTASLRDMLIRIQDRIKLMQDSGEEAILSELDVLTMIPQLSNKLGTNFRDSIFGSARINGRRTFDLYKMEEIASERLSRVDHEYNMSQRKAVQEEIDRLENKEELNPGERIQLTRFRNKLGVLNGIEFFETEDLPAIREASGLRANIVRNEFIQNLGEEDGVKAYEYYLDEEESFILQAVKEALFSNTYGMSEQRRNDYLKRKGVQGINTKGKGGDDTWKLNTARLVLREAESTLKSVFGPEFTLRSLIDGTEGFFTGRQIGTALIELETGTRLIGDSVKDSSAEAKLRSGGIEEAKRMLGTERRENAMGNVDLRKKVDLLLDYVHRATEHYILYKQDGSARQLTEEESDAVIQYYENLKELSNEEISELVPKLPYEQRNRGFRFTASENHTNAVRKWFSPQERTDRIVERVLAEPPMLHQGIHDDLTFAAIQGGLLSHAGFIGSAANPSRQAFTVGGTAGFPGAAVTPGSVADFLNIRHEAIFKNWSGISSVARHFGMSALEDIKQKYMTQLREAGVSKKDAELAANTVGLAELENALKLLDYELRGFAFDASSQAVALAKAFTEAVDYYTAPKAEQMSKLQTLKKSLGWDDETGLLSPGQRQVLLEAGLRPDSEVGARLEEEGLIEAVADYYAETWNSIAALPSDTRFKTTVLKKTESGYETVEVIVGSDKVTGEPLRASEQIWTGLWDELGSFGNKASLTPIQKFIRNKLMKRPVMTRSYGAGRQAVAGATTEFLMEALTSQTPEAVEFRNLLYKKAGTEHKRFVDQMIEDANANIVGKRGNVFKFASIFAAALADKNSPKTPTGNLLGNALNIPDAATFRDNARLLSSLKESPYRIQGWAVKEQAPQKGGKPELKLDVEERPLTFDDLSFYRTSDMEGNEALRLTQENVTELAITEATRRGWTEDVGEEMLNTLGRWYLRNRIYAEAGAAEYGQVRRVENALEEEMHRIVTESKTPATDLMLLIENFGMRRDEAVLRSMNSVNYRPDPDKWDPSLSRHGLTREDLPPLFQRSLDTGESVHSSASRSAGRSWTGLGQSSKGWGKITKRTATEEGNVDIQTEDLKIFHVRRAESDEMVHEDHGAGMDLVDVPMRQWFSMSPDERRRQVKQMAAFDLMREFAGTINPPKLQGESFVQPTMRDMYRNMVSDVSRQQQVRESMDELRQRALAIGATGTERTDPLFDAVEGQTTKTIPFSIFDSTIKTDSPDQTVPTALKNAKGETIQGEKQLVMSRKISTDMGIPHFQYAKALQTEEAAYRRKLAAAAVQEVDGGGFTASDLIVPPTLRQELVHNLIAASDISPLSMPAPQTHMGNFKLEDSPEIWQRQLYKKLLDFCERHNIPKEKLNNADSAAIVLLQMRAEEALIVELYDPHSGANRYVSSVEREANLVNGSTGEITDAGMALTVNQHQFANRVEVAIAERFEEQLGGPETSRDKYSGYTEVTILGDDRVVYPGTTPMDSLTYSAVMGNNPTNADAILGPAALSGIILGGDSNVSIDGRLLIGLMPKTVFSTDYSIGMGAPEEQMRFALYYLVKENPSMPREEILANFHSLWAKRTTDPKFLEKYEVELKKWMDGDSSIPDEFTLNSVSSLVSISVVRERLLSDPMLADEAKRRWGITVDDLTSDFLNHPSLFSMRTEEDIDLVPREFLDGVGTVVSIDIVPDGRSMWRTLDQFNRSLVNPKSYPMVQRMWFASVLEREIEKFNLKERFDMSVKVSRSFTEHSPKSQSRIERSQQVQAKMFNGLSWGSASGSKIMKDVIDLHSKIVVDQLKLSGLFEDGVLDKLDSFAVWLWYASGGNIQKAIALAKNSPSNEASILEWRDSTDDLGYNTPEALNNIKSTFNYIQSTLAAGSEDAIANLTKSLSSQIKLTNMGQLKKNRAEQIDALLAASGAREALTPEGIKTIKEDIIAEHIGDASLAPAKTEDDGLDALSSKDLSAKLAEINYPGRSKLKTKEAKLAALREHARAKAEEEAKPKTMTEALEQLAAIGKTEDSPLSDPIFQNDDGSPRLLWNESDEIILKKRYPSVFQLVEDLKTQGVFKDNLEAQKFAFLLLSNNDVLKNILPGIKFSFVGEAGTARMHTENTGVKGLVSRIEILNDMRDMDAIEAFDIIVHEIGHAAVHRAMAANQRTDGESLKNNAFFSSIKAEFRHRILHGSAEDIGMFRDAFIAIHGEEKGTKYFQEFIRSLTTDNEGGRSEYSVAVQEFIAQLYSWYLLSRSDSPEAYPFLKELNGINSQVGWQIRKMVKAFAGRRILGQASPLFNDVKLHRALVGLTELSNFSGVYQWKGRRQWDNRIFNHPGTYEYENMQVTLKEIEDKLKKPGLDPREQDRLAHMHSILTERSAMLTGAEVTFSREYLLGQALRTAALSPKDKPSPRRISVEKRDELVDRLRAGENFSSNELPLIYRTTPTSRSLILTNEALRQGLVELRLDDMVSGRSQVMYDNSTIGGKVRSSLDTFGSALAGHGGSQPYKSTSDMITYMAGLMNPLLGMENRTNTTEQPLSLQQLSLASQSLFSKGQGAAIELFKIAKKRPELAQAINEAAEAAFYQSDNLESALAKLAGMGREGSFAVDLVQTYGSEFRKLYNTTIENAYQAGIIDPMVRADLQENPQLPIHISSGFLDSTDVQGIGNELGEDIADNLLQRALAPESEKYSGYIDADMAYDMGMFAGFLENGMGVHSNRDADLAGLEEDGFGYIREEVVKWAVDNEFMELTDDTTVDWMRASEVMYHQIKSGQLFLKDAPPTWAAAYINLLGERRGFDYVSVPHRSRGINRLLQSKNPEEVKLAKSYMQIGKPVSPFALHGAKTILSAKHGGYVFGNSRLLNADQIRGRLVRNGIDTLNKTPLDLIGRFRPFFFKALETRTMQEFTRVQGVGFTELLDTIESRLDRGIDVVDGARVHVGGSDLAKHKANLKELRDQYSLASGRNPVHENDVHDDFLSAVAPFIGLATSIMTTPNWTMAAMTVEGTANVMRGLGQMVTQGIRPMSGMPVRSLSQLRDDLGQIGVSLPYHLTTLGYGHMWQVDTIGEALEAIDPTVAESTLSKVSGKAKKLGSFGFEYVQLMNRYQRLIPAQQVIGKEIKSHKGGPSRLEAAAEEYLAAPPDKVWTSKELTGLAKKYGIDRTRFFRYQQMGALEPGVAKRIRKHAEAYMPDNEVYRFTDASDFVQRKARGGYYTEEYKAATIVQQSIFADVAKTNIEHQVGFGNTKTHPAARMWAQLSSYSIMFMKTAMLMGVHGGAGGLLSLVVPLLMGESVYYVLQRMKAGESPQSLAQKFSADPAGMMLQVMTRMPFLGSGTFLSQYLADQALSIGGKMMGDSTGFLSSYNDKRSNRLAVPGMAGPQMLMSLFQNFSDSMRKLNSIFTEPDSVKQGSMIKELGVQSAIGFAPFEGKPLWGTLLRLLTDEWKQQSSQPTTNRNYGGTLATMFGGMRDTGGPNRQITTIDQMVKNVSPPTPMPGASPSPSGGAQAPPMPSGSPAPSSPAQGPQRPSGGPTGATSVLGPGSASQDLASKL